MPRARSRRVCSRGGVAPRSSPHPPARPFASPRQLSERYGTPLDAAAPGKSRGLSAAEAAARLAKYGKNRLSPPKATPEWVKFLLTFTNPFMIVLTVAGALCFLAWGVGDHSDSTNAILGGVLWIVVFLTCTMTYFQGRSTSAVMDTFAKMLPQQCTVVRDGGEARIPAEDLVPGDFVRLGLGDRVPADIRLVSVNDLKVEMSSLTGEPDAIALSVERQHDSNVESRAIAFNSALVMNGEGRGVVIRTGDNTFIGKIAGLASATTGDSMSSMEREVLHFVHQVTVIAICTSILFFIIGASRAPSREGIVAAFINGMIIVMVAFVPEGLPGECGDAGVCGLPPSPPRRPPPPPDPVVPPPPALQPPSRRACPSPRSAWRRSTSSSRGPTSSRRSAPRR